MKIEKKKNLKDFNFYKIKVKTKYFVELKNKNDFVEIFEWIEKEKIKKHFFLGEGSNIIFKKTFYDGVVIKISNNFSKWENRKRVEIGAGKNLDKFLAQCQKKNIFEIQALSSIPGSVGAGVFGNVGAFGREIKNFVFGVWVFDIKEKKFIFIESKKCNFSYRNSVFKNEGLLIFSVVFDFSKKFQAEISKLYNKEEYFSLNHFAKKYNLGKIKKSEIRKNIKKLRKDFFPNVEKFPNVGSTFGNTEIAKKEFKIIIKNYPDIPNWEQRNKKIKIPTAFIFDKILELNGKKFGNIKIDEKRPLFFLNLGGATGQEFFNLCKKIKKDTEKKIGIKIKEEVFFIE